MNKQGWVALLGTQISVLLLFVSILVVFSRIGQAGHSYMSVVAVKGEKGDRGTAGVQGIRGDIGPASTIPGPKGEKGDRGPQGPVGSTGQAGTSALARNQEPSSQSPEMRENPTTGKTEWRCTGDTIWTTLASSPILKNSCL